MRIDVIATGCVVLASLTLGGCGGPPAPPVDANLTTANDGIVLPPDEVVDPAAALPTTNVASLPPVEPIPPGQPGGLPNDRTPVSEAPFTADSAQGAANVVQSYYALIEQRRYADAYALWEPQAVAMTGKGFADSFAPYADYHAQIGAPGAIDAGAGQRYVTVPVQAYGRRVSGAPFHLRGEVTLHRTGDIDGATAAQRSWRIRGIALKPVPGADQ
ncbi:hypothetical protein [Sphingomonas sp.]|uniref:hypothetical protein n=1 Tax=Sphingomonas sp. TaxID=28214 RepID=UPI002BFE5252|nr:hypothetical protein [Sphingomonas sp.]HWK36237.1 hypothetical protein [Sphingomonas sp.]